MKLFWIVVAISIALSIYFAAKEFSVFFVVSMLNLVGLIIAYKESESSESIKKIEKKIDSIDFDRIIKKIDALRDGQNSYLAKVFEVEMELSKYKEEQEEKYRDVVKKVLEMDNKLTEKYELLGKSILKLSKDVKKS